MVRNIGGVGKLGTIGIISLGIFLSGCTVVLQKGRTTDIQKIKELTKDIERLKRLKDEEIRELDEAKSLLEKRLRQEIADKRVRLEMAEKGLVITFVTEVLFDSGKAKIRPEAYSTLDKVVRVLKEEIGNRNIGIEGHTDNEPIKYSGWRSNWELSTARATSVLHYLVDEGKIPPERVSAIGYGEYRPVASNETAEGRQLNRRVEIVILPKILKLKPETEATEEIPRGVK